VFLLETVAFSCQGGATMRVVNQMLTEMDGVQERQGVYLLAASNRPDIIDPAVLRPGRFDKILFVGLPTASDRIEILRAITKVKSLSFCSRRNEKKI
jgi:ribosome biogenesis ATPase